MASNHGNSTHSELETEQIITEFFAKSLHIILESRCPYVSSRNYSGEQVMSSPCSSSSSSSSFRPRDKWFNLALRDCPAALENIDFWRQSNYEPMIVDVILVQRPRDWDPMNCSPKRGLGQNLYGKERYHHGSDDEFGGDAKREKIIERWVLQYKSKKGGVSGGGLSGSKRSTCTSSHGLYKKSMLLLRSLYVTVRLLPAYKLFRDLISSARIQFYNLCHRVSSFVEPFTHVEEADMQHFVFSPVDTYWGKLCLSVSYNSSALDLSSEPSTPLTLQFISEYVGSPMAEPLKRFPSGTISHSSSSLSPSPSPPTYIPGSYKSKSLLRSESAPVSIPASRLSCISSLPKNLLMPPSPPVQATLSTDAKQDAHGGNHQISSSADKLFSFSKDEPGKMPGVKQSSNSSPSKFSRSSSRISFLDDCDDSKFSGPFILEDCDMIYPQSRPGSFNQPEPLPGTHGPGGLFPVKKSQDAEVGALVRMLEKAPPLRQDFSSAAHFLQGSKTETPKTCISDSNEISEQLEVLQSATINLSSSGPVSSKTTTDALDELRVHRELKDGLLKQGKISQA